MLMSLSWNVFHPFQSGFGVYVTVQRGTPSMNPRHFEATFWKTIGPEWHEFPSPRLGRLAVQPQPTTQICTVLHC